MEYSRRQSQPAIDAVKDLYNRIGTVQEGVVRWDMPATFIRRLGKNFVLKEFSNSKTDFEKELTIGFKFLAGLYDKGVKKENIENLGKKNLNWSFDIDQLISDLKNMLKLIGSFKYFKYLNSWRTNLMDITSDAIAIDFLLIAYLDWERKGKPIGTDTTAKVFQKNCFVLWDKLIYEYIFKLWRGAADQKTANNIEQFDREQERFEALPIFKENSIDGVPVSQGLMKPLLYHMYCLKCISGPDTENEIEVDHIIPQALFNSAYIKDGDVIQHNILNLGLLPKNENGSKGNKRLVEITDQWLRGQIQKYEFIEPNDHQRFSDVNNYPEMFEFRKSHIVDAFEKDRTSMMNN